MIKLGRPPKFKTVEEMEKAIEKYFTSCQGENGSWKTPLTITGLARAIGLTRRGLLAYEVKPEFVDTVKEAKKVVEQFVEESMFNGKNVAGVIFNAKNNFSNWKDKTEVENTVKTYVEYVNELPDEDDNIG